ncbi:HAD family hydrolase [Thermococcus radiotolerans]|uniref:2-haloalkanoic acid dehalogenase n=1 Tax=Thermococcus radiotolerans TaxID=187880 RepID=A0A2Z2MXE0_9EURY|nr:HAD family hydrolase [Thermococcus radiotolerans]ASJ14101.1 2-haloalkanoic acid dehalogenase [Thermococcus radiotolerans]
MLKGLIFDVDETLVYYEGYDHREWYEKWVMPALRERGIELDYETYRKTVTGELPRSYIESFGINHVEFWKIVDGVNLEYRRWMAERGKIRPFPDVDALGELKAMGLRLAAVSNASQECTEFVLNLFDLRKHFEVVYGKDYSNLDGVKPSPYLVEKALKALNLKPREALMIGDSRHDVLAGKRAGMKVVNVTRFDKIEGADYYVSDLRELVGLVRKML